MNEELMSEQTPHRARLVMGPGFRPWPPLTFCVTVRKSLSSQGLSFMSTHWRPAGLAQNWGPTNVCSVPFCALTLTLHFKHSRSPFSALPNGEMMRTPPGSCKAGLGQGVGVSVGPWVGKLLETVWERRGEENPEAPPSGQPALLRGSVTLEINQPEFPVL